MKTRGILFLVCVFITVYSSCKKTDWLDFHTLMQSQQFPQARVRTEKLIGINGDQLLAFFCNLYETFQKAEKKNDSSQKIPKKIHHIWLGSPLPQELKAFVESWKKIHGDEWEYYLWTDEDIKAFGLYNQHFYDETDNYGTKSDIARWEILYRYGGVYVDIDFECLRRLDELHEVSDFYTGLQPLDAFFVQLGAALVGSIPEHPILKHCIETIEDDWHHKGAPTKTGPVHFTKSFAAVAGKTGFVDVALPAPYFYPLSHCNREFYTLKDKAQNKKKQDWIEHGSFAVHHWSKTWMPPQYRPIQFKSIDNYESARSWND